MNIPTTLKHKPVIVAEDYEQIDGRSAYHSDAKGTTAANLTSPPKSGAIPARNGPASRRSCRCIGSSILPSSSAAPGFSSGRRATVFPRATIPKSLSSTGSGCRVTP